MSSITKQTSLTENGYAILKTGLSHPQTIQLYSRLTVTPLTHPDYPSPASIAVYETTRDVIRVPRQWGIDHFGPPTTCTLGDYPCPNLEFQGTLRPNQLEPHQLTLKHLSTHGSGVLSLPTGHGKTIITLSLLAQLKQRACILVHKTHLLQQWKEQIATFLPRCKVGTVQGSRKTFDSSCDIILVMIQTMTNIPTVPPMFGTTVVDETHHLPSASFSKCMYKVNTKFMLGLSATPSRKDGLTKVLLWHLGPIIYEGKPDRTAQHSTDIYFCKYNCRMTLDPRRHAEMITRLTQHKGRNAFIVSTIKYFLARDTRKHRYILVLSERRDHATLLYEAIRLSSDRSCGLVLGGMSKEVFDIEKEKQIVFSTYQALSEGVDIQNLNTLVLATPKTDIVQSMGRIFRKVHTEVNPIIADILDTQLYAKSRKRLSAYKSELNGNLRVHDI